MRFSPPKLFATLLLLLVSTPFVAQQIDNGLLKEMQWRSIGPFRGGRTRAVSGVPTQPNVFYIGVVNGGVWKTTDYGRTWQPIFDSQPTGSIGAIAVAPSAPETIYVASGEGLHRPDLSVGDGVYKSTDGGASWTHLGLRDGQQIPTLAVDPHDPNRVFAAVAGHPYGPNPERGIYRSTDGGQSFQQVIGKGENIGGKDVKIDPSDPNIVYATLWDAREGPWENGSFYGSGAGIFKSTDGGSTWKQLTGGLPAEMMQAYITISQTNPKRLFASIATKTKGDLYRSDDGGETWVVATSDPRPKNGIGGPTGDLPVPMIDPKNPDVVYVTSVVTWKSTDGGKTWTGFRGAPGGDDYQNIWINPNDPKTIAIVSDQGGIVSVNGGESWGSWYNQPTAQMYHVNADNAFPYRLCSGQQESGSACIRSRGNDGQLTFREWHPVAAEEYGYVVPDPLDPDVVYGGKLTRYDRRTDQAANIMPNPLRSGGDFRVLRTEPIVFSPQDPHLMYFAANTLWATHDGGQTWKQVSPDLTRKTWEIPATVGVYKSDPAAQPKQRGVIYTVAPSPVDGSRIWAGTDDGLIWLTTDGGANWNNITPSQLTAWQKISIIEASHSDAQTAYAAVNTIRLDDLRPHIYRTRDSGKTWTEIVKGIPDNENVNAVREDPKRKGLLYATTERAVYVSFDDGEQWQSLRLNLPATSVRDLIVKDNDLAIATHGRGFWILDDITPLRQLDDKVLSSSFLFAPEPAYRVRWNMNTDTPLPPDEPAGKNPPDGAILNYYLKGDSTAPVTLEILDSTGKLVRRYSSDDPLPPANPELDIPAYWVRPPQKLSNAAGFHRFLWDMHYAPVPGITPEYPIAAIYHDTAPARTSPWAMPGKYTVVLTAGGQKYTQPLTLVMDPRVKTPEADLKQQFDISYQLYQDLLTIQPILTQATTLRTKLDAARANISGADAAKYDSLSKKLEALVGGGGRRRGPQPESLSGEQAALAGLLTMVHDADVAPSTPVVQAAQALHASAGSLIGRWKQIETTDLPPLKNQLGISDLRELQKSLVGQEPAHSVNHGED